ncbi:hypothetical protein [Microbulbifer sp. SAOS-129_SWC]
MSGRNPAGLLLLLALALAIASCSSGVCDERRSAPAVPSIPLAHR